MYVSCANKKKKKDEFFRFTCIILSMRFVFWKSYSIEKCIWPTFSLGSELSMYMSTIDTLRFCRNAIFWFCLFDFGCFFLFGFWFDRKDHRHCHVFDIFFFFVIFVYWVEKGNINC